MTHASSRRVFSTSLLAAAAMLGAPRAQATGLDTPRENPILSISGKIAVTNKDGAAQFDRAMLEALGTESFETTTPWYTGAVRFEGVPLRKLMQAVGANGERVAVVALNDYSSEIPISDFAQFNVILALKRNGEYMPIRDKGPLFVVYPFDSQPELKAQKYYSRSVWQVAKLIVK